MILTDTLINKLTEKKYMCNMIIIKIWFTLFYCLFSLYKPITTLEFSMG